MKRSLTTALAVLLMAGTLFAGGIVHNTNQSAMYTRMGNRAATLGIDAVYYNPAGLTKLADGFHFSINNQSIGQTRTVTSNYNYLGNEYREASEYQEYIGDVTAPLYPGVYGVFKLGKWAFSLGFNPIGGGGTATYDNGLPSFEYPISDLPPAMQLQGQDIRGYRLNSKFDGSSVFYGIQANVSYAITDMISVALGGRYIIAKENYSGYLKNIELNNGGAWIPATTFFSNAAEYATQVATDANTAATALQAAIDAGAGDMALADPTLIGALTAAGVYFAGMTNAQAQGAFQGIAATATTQAAQSTFYAGLLADQEVDAEKTAGGFTPIVSVNFQPIDMLNIAVKYEHNTSLKLTTSVADDMRGLIGVEDDGITPKYMFTDGEETNLDIPGYLSLGATLRPIESLLIAGYYGYFFEKGANWDKREELLESNSWELGLGVEYNLSEKFLISGGWLMTKSGASTEYQTDLSHSLSSQGFNIGAAWDILPLLQLNVGGQYVKYGDAENKFDHDFASQGIQFVPVTETLQRYAWVVGVGLNISIGSGGN